MDQFTKQLANLQRAASRAGRDDNGGGGGRGGGGRGGPGGGRGEPGRGRGRDAPRDGMNGQHDNRRNEGRYNDTNNSRRDDHRGNYDSRGGGGGRGSYRHDERRSDHGRHEYNNPRKRGRYDNDRRDDRREYNSRDNGRDYYSGGNRGGGRGSGGGRYGGRWNHEHSSRSRGRDEQYQTNRNERQAESNSVMAELVKEVATKHSAAQAENDLASKAGNTTTMATTTTPKRRHIALLFLTIDNLPHEHVWREWLQSGSSDYLKSEKKDVRDDMTNRATEEQNGNVQEIEDALVSIICHAKYPERITSSWQRQRHLLQRNTNNARNNGDDGSPKYHSRRPEWGSIEITRAMIDLLEEGLRIGVSASAETSTAGKSDSGDATENNGEKETPYHRYFSTPCDSEEVPPVDRFIFVSESCLPVATLKELELALFGPRSNSVDTSVITEADAKQQQVTDQSKPPPAPSNLGSLYNKSWVNARSTPNNGYAKQQQWDAIRQSDIPQNLIWKADQWLVLTRQHGEAIASLSSNYLGGRQLWQMMRKVRASDEIYFPTALSILGILHRPTGVSEVDDNTLAKVKKKESCAGEGIRRRRITYCDWSVGAKNPASFTCSDWKDIVKKARGEGCLFARKFVLESSIPGVKKKKSLGSDDNNDGLVSVEAWRSVFMK